jgi:GDPmannose 4,6-dehydratase
MERRALITGITGQDGSYLAEFLLAQGYQVHGLVRRVALHDPERHLSRLAHIRDRLVLHAGSLESSTSLQQVVDGVRPDECYHLAAHSFVNTSFEDDLPTLGSDISGTHYLLAALTGKSPACRFYFAGTSEMFGNADESPQRETSRFLPRSTYGINKVAGYHLTRNYRERFGLHASTGILYNHESPRRGNEFVTRRIAVGVAQILTAGTAGARKSGCAARLGARPRLRAGHVAYAAAEDAGRLRGRHRGKPHRARVRAAGFRGGRSRPPRTCLHRSRAVPAH